MGKEEIELNLKKIINSLEEIKARYGLKQDVVIEAVTKGIEVERILWAYECGIRVMGENRVQEALMKIPFITLDIEWHMIGHLQTNKVKHALKIFKVIESVDRVELVKELSKRASEPIEVFVEVNTSGEAQKTGCNPDDVDSIVEAIMDRENLLLSGLMTIGPYPVEEKRSREAFAKLREIKEKLENSYKIELRWLSMGMTEDYQFAIMEGANLVRIGRGIFGEVRQ